MGDFNERLRSKEQQKESQQDAGWSDIARTVDVEELTDHERRELGQLFEELRELRRAEAPSVGLGEWQDLLGRVKSELGRQDLTTEERRSLLRDVYFARPRGRLRWALAISAGIVGVIASTWWLWIR